MRKITIKVTEEEYKRIRECYSINELGTLFNNCYQRGDWEEVLI